MNTDRDYPPFTLFPQQPITAIIGKHIIFQTVILTSLIVEIQIALTWTSASFQFWWTPVEYMLSPGLEYRTPLWAASADWPEIIGWIRCVNNVNSFICFKSGTFFRILCLFMFFLNFLSLLLKSFFTIKIKLDSQVTSLPQLCYVHTQVQFMKTMLELVNGFSTYPRAKFSCQLLFPTLESLL